MARNSRNLYTGTMTACMALVREIAVLNRRRKNNLKLEFTTTIYLMRTRAASYTYVRVQ